MDLLLNENHDVQLDDRNDLAVVTGDRAVEQSIAVLVSAYFYEEIGSINRTNAIENLQLHAERVVDENEYITDVADITVTRDGASLRVTIHYDTGETADFTVN